METNHDLGKNIRKPWTLSQNDLNLNLEPCDCYAYRFGRKFWIAGVGVSMCFCTHKMAQFDCSCNTKVRNTNTSTGSSIGASLVSPGGSLVSPGGSLVSSGWLACFCLWSATQLSCVCTLVNMEDATLKMLQPHLREEGMLL